MILVTFKNSTLVVLYLELLKKEIKTLIKKNKNLLKGIFNNFSQDQIDSAIDSIYVYGKSIYCPTSGTNGKILRALEYGASYNNARHIISQATNNLLKGVNKYEYEL